MNKNTYFQSMLANTLIIINPIIVVIPPIPSIIPETVAIASYELEICLCCAKSAGIADDKIKAAPPIKKPVAGITRKKRENHSEFILDILQRVR